MFGWTLLDGSGQEIGHSPRFPDAEAAEAEVERRWQRIRAMSEHPLL